MTLKLPNWRDPAKPDPNRPNICIATRAYLVNNEEFWHVLSRMCEWHGETKTLKQFWQGSMPYLVINLNDPFTIFGTSKSLLKLDIPPIASWGAATKTNVTILICGGDNQLTDTVRDLMRAHQGEATLIDVSPTESGWRVSFTPPQKMEA